jgi:hypothetical protein
MDTVISHVKPTQEELEANAQKAAKEAEELAKVETPPTEKDPEDNTPPEIKLEEVVTVDPSELSDRQKAFLSEHKGELTPEQQVKYGLKQAVEQESEEEKKRQAKIDYEEKFRNSSRQAQLEGYKNKELNKAIIEASKITDIPEEELIKEIKDWELMTDTEKRLSKDNLINKRKFDLINKASDKFKEVDEWDEKADKFVKDPIVVANNPEIEGKEEDFKAYANNPERRNTPFDVLLSAFLHDVEKIEKPKHKGKMMESGSAGPNTPIKPKSNKIPFNQAMIMKQTNYNDYVKNLKAGNIESVDEE